MTVADASIGVRLSEGLVLKGPLLPSAIARGLETLERLATVHHLATKRVRVVATAVLRNTCDPLPFTVPAEQILGHPIDIISGEEEARLTRDGAVEGIVGETDWIILDIGGQSTEISWQEGGLWQSVSLEMGVVGLTEQYLDGDPPTPASMEEMRGAVRAILRQSIPSGLEGGLLAVAGTASSLGMLDQSLSTWHREKIHGYRMSGDALRRWMAIMSSIPSGERQRHYGVRPVRADVFPAGICVLEEVVRYVNQDGFTISASGLRLGAALSIL